MVTSLFGLRCIQVVVMISAAPWLINKSVQTEIACVSQQREATKLKDAQSRAEV